MTTPNHAVESNINSRERTMDRFPMLKAQSVLSEILKNFEEGNDPLHGSALLFEDSRTLVEHVRQAVEALDEGLRRKQ
jgi:hypothetical protein